MSKMDNKSKKSNDTIADANTLANKYQQKTDKQHILDNPDTYIGSIEIIDSELYVMNEIDGKYIIKENTIQYIPGLFKLFDEGNIDWIFYS